MRRIGFRRFILALFFVIFTNTAAVAGAPGASVSPTSLAFGNQQVGTTSATQYVTVTNTGNVTITFGTTPVTGDFRLAGTGSCGNTLAAGASCTKSIAFSPLTTGALTGVLTINSNAPNSPQTVPLSGTGVPVPPTISASLSPTSLAFGNQQVDTTSATQYVTVTNTGNVALTFGTTPVTGDFRLAGTGSCGNTLAAGASCTKSIAFSPLTTGALTGVLTINSNAPNSPQTVPLSGTGVPVPPTISAFTATPATIIAGSSSTLAWTTTGATSVSINQGVGTVALSGTKSVTPTTTTVYTLTATNSGGSVSMSTTVTVSAAPPTISAFTATPAKIIAGSSSTLAWTTTGATSVSISQGIGTVALSGTASVMPTIGTTYTLTATNSAGAVSQSVTVSVSTTSAGAIPETYMGLTINDSALPFPTISFGMERYWDTAQTQWPYINTAPGVYDWDAGANGGLDSMLATDYKRGVLTAFYTLNRTPNWALSPANQSGAAAENCNDYGVGGQTTGASAPGQCYPPADLNSDGSGTNQTWKNWVTAIAEHVNGKDGTPGNSTYLANHAHIKYWEPWNEVDRSDIIANSGVNASYEGTFAQLIRMTEDARCIITGKGVVHSNGLSKAPITCTNTPIDSAALIVMPSAHTYATVDLQVGQNFLYCNASSKCSGNGSAGADAVDVINFHMKPATVSPDVELQMQTEVSDIEGILQPNEKNKPLWNGEAGYSGKGWGAMTDPDLQAAFVGRYFLLMWSLGINGANWYTWDNSNTLNGTAYVLASEAYQSMYNWLVGATMSTSCAAHGTQWTCGLTRTSPANYEAEAIWDTSQTCTGGVCTAPYVTVDTKWQNYLDLEGNSTSIPKAGTHANQVPVGIKPILLQN